MMKEELEKSKDERTPFKTAGMTFLSFVTIGLIPLLAYLFAILNILEPSNLFLVSCILTGIALAIVGSFKSGVTNKNKLVGVIETLFLGGIAAFLAYYVGAVLETIFK